MKRKLPSKLFVLDALKRRIDHNHDMHELVTSLMRRAEIGYRGELKVDRLWQEITVPSNSYLFHNYESQNDFGNSHQIDSLFICPHFILILEIKNISGLIWYEKEKYQFMRKKLTGEIESFQSPFEQVQRHVDFMERIVERLGLELPLHKAVVIAETSTVIGNVPEEIPVFHSIGLPSEIKKLLLKYNSPALSSPHYEMLVNQIQKIHKPSIYKPKFEIPPLRKGAICECGRVMEFHHGKFVCICGLRSKEPLYQGLHDYRYLFDEWITNQEFRKFFLIESRDAANKLLKRTEFYCEGNNKGRRYLIPEDVWRIN
ncbi:nuclease-related domain-containing protein [Lysinibacillus yapensis]|nr:nuclease-related domain-containing protein [Lysinibacillus yapensis]